MDSVLG